MPNQAKLSEAFQRGRALELELGLGDFATMVGELGGAWINWRVEVSVHSS